MKLTREQALELHRKMWTDMQAKLGDYPNPHERNVFKTKWCERWLKENGYPPETRIRAHCFLCEYAYFGYGCYGCFDCPIDWSKADHISTRGYEDADCTDLYILLNLPCGGDYYPYYKVAPISEILSLPEKGGGET